MTAEPPAPGGAPSRIGCGLAGLASIALGILCATLAWRGGVGEWPGLEETWRTWRHPTAEGTVVRNEVRPFGRKTMTYPVVRYEVGGRRFQLSGNGRSPAEFDVGEKVSVRYDPGSPGNGRIVGFQQQYLPPLAILVAAAVLLGLGGIAVAMAFEKRRPPGPDAGGGPPLRTTG